MVRQDGFAGFARFDVDTPAGTIHGVRGGNGPPLLLLHGIPETHLMWRDVAPALAHRFTVVATDLRGFGDSAAPAGSGVDSSMRSLAADQADVMTALGFDRFAVAGHDRGARCTYRLAIEAPERVRRLAVIDIIPTGDAYERADRDFADGFWVWSFLAAPEPVPEVLIARSPDVFVDHLLAAWSAPGFRFPASVRDRYVDQFRDPARCHAICEQYRAAATADVEMDLADRDRRPIRCPVCVLWSGSGPVGTWYDPLAIWGRWADDVIGRPLPGGHFGPEEVPDSVVEALLGFLDPTSD